MAAKNDFGKYLYFAVIRKGFRKSLFLSGFAVILILVLIIGSPGMISAGAEADATTVTLDPSSATIMDNETLSVNIRINDITSLYGADVRLSFDPELLSVIDADDIQQGINLGIGDILVPPYFMIYNTADNTTGEIKYALTQLHPTEPFSGSGVLAVINFQAKKAGVSDLKFDYVKLGDGNGVEIPATSISGTITIKPLNHAPVIMESDPQTVAMSEDGDPTPFSLTLHASDEDDDTLIWSISSPASNGVATASGTGTTKSIGYSPNDDYSGADSFKVQVSDGLETDVITVNVTVSAVNDAPIITEGYTTTVIMDDVFDLTLHATDVDGDVLYWSISTPASHGTALVDDTPGFSKVIGYTPVSGYYGDDNFVVLVTDNHGGEDTIIVNVTINPAEPDFFVFLPVLMNYFE